MADVTINCPNCSKPVTVSEYTNEKMVQCSACNTAVSVPERQKKRQFKLRRNNPPPPDVQVPPIPIAPGKEVKVIPHSPSIADRRNSAYLKKDIRRVKRDKWIRRSSWLLFALLAGVLCYMRFYGGFNQYVPLDDLKQYGLIAIGALYLLIIFCAVKDNMFDGLLALAVPLYPFYYVFLVSGALVLRAITAALLLAFGLDMLGLLQEWSLRLIDIINYWIRNA